MPKTKKETFVSLFLLALGIIALASSIIYTSSILAFIGLGFTFWGALLLYIKPERYVKVDLLDSTVLSTLETINNLLTNLNYKGKAIYLPPKHLKDLKSAKAFIPSKNQTTIPSTEELTEETILSTNPEGIFLTPPGLALTNLYEEKLGTSFTKQDVQYLLKNLPKLLIEDLEIAENLEIKTSKNVVHIKITGSVFQNLCKKTEKLSKINKSLGSPLLSSLAITLTRTTGKPITIKKTNLSKDNKTIKVYYQMIEE